MLLILVVLLSAGSGLYAGASFFPQQAPNVTTTTTIYTTTTSWTTSTIWSTVTSVVQGVLTTIEYTTSTSTVTVAGSTGSDTSTKLLLHMDGTDGSQAFVDGSLQAHTITANGNAQIDTAQSKFGGTSGLFDGTGDWIDTPDSADFTFGSGDFTIDFWFRLGATGILQFIFGQSNSAGAATSCSSYAYISVANKLTAVSYVGSTQYTASSGTALRTGVWYHAAIVRSSTTFSVYLDGVRGATTANIGASSVNDSPNKFAVGRVGEYTSNTFNGWIDEFRISNGVARWTSNFTPPTAPY
jgi:hypothetical protein